MTHPIEAMQAIYDSLPTLKCKKKCWTACGPIHWSAIEDRRIMGATGGLRLTVNPNTLTCPYLTEKKLCGIYEHRPLLCRLWGLVDESRMRCPHGCKPKPRYLTSEEGHELLARMDAIQPLKFFGDHNPKPKEE